MSLDVYIYIYIYIDKYSFIVYLFNYLLICMCISKEREREREGAGEKEKEKEKERGRGLLPKAGSQGKPPAAQPPLHRHLPLKAEKHTTPSTLNLADIEPYHVLPEPA